jgi:hypothetical protein
MKHHTGEHQQKRIYRHAHRQPKLKPLSEPTDEKQRLGYKYQKNYKESEHSASVPPALRLKIKCLIRWVKPAMLARFLLNAVLANFMSHCYHSLAREYIRECVRIYIAYYEFAVLRYIRTQLATRHNISVVINI